MIAVTGAAGFLGSNLSLRLAAAGHELLLADHPLTAGKAENLAGLERFQFVEHEPFLSLLEHDRPKLDGVFHLLGHPQHAGERRPCAAGQAAGQLRCDLGPGSAPGRGGVATCST